jgi:predicted Zn-dependent protease
LPGGKISITRGLLSRMDNEAELAGVLGHEIGHVTARHVSTALTRQLTAQLVMAAMTAYLKEKEVKHSEYYSLAGLLATQLMMLKFSRSQESQADELGIQYMAKLNYNTEGFVQMLEILHSAQSREPTVVEGWISSHPLTRDRIEAAKSQIAQSGSTSADKTFNEDGFKRRIKILQQVEPAYKHYDQAEKMMAEGQIQQAIAEYKKAIEIAPNQAIFYSDLAFAYFKSNQLTESQSNIDKALQLYPDLFQSQFYSGLIYFQAKDYRRSLASFDVADKLIPEQPSVKLNQGMCYENLKNTEMAVKKYQEVLKLTGEGEIAQKAQERLNALGYSE